MVKKVILGVNYSFNSFLRMTYCETFPRIPVLYLYIYFSDVQVSKYTGVVVIRRQVYYLLI